jgi:TonB family protein
VVERLLALGAEASDYEYLGIHKIEDRTSLLSITSARQGIAFSARRAAAKGGRYLPPADVRIDVVFITCGDADLGERWDCLRLSTADSLGRPVAPLTYSSGPKTYRNALGATWTASRVTATYRFVDLSNGFTVRYSGGDDTEFTEVVPASKVRADLLWDLPLTNAAREAAKEAEKAAAKATLDAEPDPPALLIGALDSTDAGWNVTSLTQGYTWTNCTLIAGGFSAALEPLEPGVRIPVARPDAIIRSQRAVVRCSAKGRTYDGLVPAKFVIAVERADADGWRIHNLTDWGWSNCEAAFGTARAPLLGFVQPRSTVSVRRADFTPNVDSSEDPSSMTLSCATGGVRVSAIQTLTAEPQAPRERSTSVRRVGGEILEPRKLKHVKPEYPPIARSARVQGVVEVEVEVGQNGKVLTAKTVRSIPLLDQAALDAVRQWEFAPTVVDGAPVTILMTVKVEFALP